MPDGGFVSVLGRKIAAGRPAADPAEMTPVKAFSMALARAAERVARLPLGVMTASHKELTADEIVESLPEPALLVTLDGPQGGLGLAALGCGTVAALIEMVMLGRLGANPPPPRRPTRTDAAMLAGFIEGILAELDQILVTDLAADWLADFHYGTQLGDPRPLALMLDAPKYQVLRADIAFGDKAGGDGGDARRGEVIVLVPASGLPRAPAAKKPDRPAETREAAGSGEWAKRLERAVLHANTEVTAILARITLPLASLLRLDAGVSLSLPENALGSVQLQGSDGRLLGLGHLGQGNGRRAVRLAADQPDDPAVAPPPTATRVIPGEVEGGPAEPMATGQGALRATLADPQRRAWEEALHGPDTGGGPATGSRAEAASA